MHLANQLAKYIIVNLEARFETTYSNLPLFQGEVIIRELEIAKREALLEYLEDLVMFTDRAKQGRVRQERARVGLL